MPAYHIPQLNLHVKGIDPAVVRAALDLLPGRIAAELGGNTGSRPMESTASASAARLAERIARQVGQQWRDRTAQER
jgi:hypothetical protein